ncbi:MAG TPA: pantoate--beta-alanine ligase [Chitinophagales bacterium]|nr:pantoate--beta-alanine ligase [Chitinophagales bacterium]HMU98608.1 pantoate--beta-alanine ligase [Chitinophagales bacterium]HMV03052.1 pantoate--beta-alanine ligase [Chitinophagales bacterium]HMW94907.1 pantoate--beta-alanine ligase [Chitinophagales bacterium]HMY42836.1 pantoate--beta-alanine ligase [Chitinophagales bacterium]
MKVFSSIIEIRKFLDEQSESQLIIGFVPTMGALHQGHLSLIEQSKKSCDITICSIFVNPTQFNDKKDFEKYPIQIDADLEMLIAAGCDVVFIPSVDEMYPEGTTQDKLLVDLGFLGKTLEAEKRPGHYEGVIQIVKKLLDIVQPNLLFLGQKDYQQCIVIQKLIDTFNIPTKIVICTTKREVDGLAMSSRNVRLSDAARKVALKLFQALTDIQNRFKTENIAQIIAENINFLNQDNLIETEYLVVVNGKTLELILEYNEQIPITALVAAKVGEVRLIDNLILQA